MKKKTLNDVGINTIKDIPVQDIFCPAINKENYGLDTKDIKKLKALKRFCKEYNDERPNIKKSAINTSEKAVKVIKDILRDMDHEEVWVAFLDRSNCIIDCIKITVGGLDQTIFDKKRILRTAIELNAYGIIIFHNHPSGSPLPSKADIEETASLKTMANTCDVILLDHIIVSDSQYFAFSENEVKPMPA